MHGWNRSQKKPIIFHTSQTPRSDDPLSSVNYRVAFWQLHTVLQLSPGEVNLTILTFLMSKCLLLSSTFPSPFFPSSYWFAEVSCSFAILAELFTLLVINLLSCTESRNCRQFDFMSQAMNFKWIQFPQKKKRMKVPQKFVFGWCSCSACKHTNLT